MFDVTTFLKRYHLEYLKRELHPNQKPAYFVLYLKILNNFLKCIWRQIVQGTKI